MRPDKKKAWRGGMILSCALLAGCSLFHKPAPDTAARDAYKAAKAACTIYELSPGDKRSDDMDRACRSLRLVCE